MLIFPYRSDAPLYHLPVVTIGLIVLNVAAYAAMAMGELPSGGWLLTYGTGLHPQQWLLSSFMHGGVGHLLGNMIFLWIFGLVIEGRIGWWRFLLCYLGLAMGESAIEQILMFHATGGSLGASAAIFGLMAMACVWSPMNEVTFAFFFLFLFHPIIRTFEVTIGVLAAFYVGLEITFFLLLGSLAMSSMLHLLGAGLGFALAVAMLKWKWVDCEYWDIFHVFSGHYGPDAQKKAEEITPEQREAHERSQATEAKHKLLGYLQFDRADDALALYRKMQDLGNPLDLDRQEMLDLVVALHKHHHWTDAAPLMAEFIEQFPEGSELMRLKLAQISLVELQRPSKALELIEPLAAAQLPDKQEALRRKIFAAARQQLAEGVIEMDGPAW